MRTNFPTQIKQAEAIFIAGGDQWNYIRFWKDTPVMDLLREAVRERNVPIGGTSAGCAVLGEFIFSAEIGSAVSAETLKDPYNRQAGNTRSAPVCFSSECNWTSKTHTHQHIMSGQIRDNCG